MNTTEDKIVKGDLISIVATSDLHGYLPKVSEEFDIMFVCGDICPAHDHYYSFQIEYLKNEFVDYVNSLPFKNPWSKIVVVGGNHDFVFERLSEIDLTELSLKTGGRLVVLKNEHYNFEYLTPEGEIKTLKIFGTPYCRIIGNWAFTLDNQSLAEKYSVCDEDVDIIISHDSPDLNDLGTIHQAYYTKNVGNAPLAECVLRCKPQYVFCGHIHSGNHRLELIEGTTTLAKNVSYVAESYYPYDEVVEVMKLYIEPKNKKGE